MAIVVTGGLSRLVLISSPRQSPAQRAIRVNRFGLDIGGARFISWLCQLVEGNLVVAHGYRMRVLAAAASVHNMTHPLSDVTCARLQVLLFAGSTRIGTAITRVRIRRHGTSAVR